MTALCDWEHNKNQPAHYCGAPEPVHFHTIAFTLMVVGRNGEIRHNCGQERKDGTDVEIPSPGRILTRHTSEEDADEKAGRRHGAVNAEDHVLPWIRPVHAPEQRQTRRQVSRRPQPLYGTAEIQHKLVLREATDESPHGRPRTPSQVNWKAAVDVRQTPKRQ
jgi:hypothetical protein